MIQPTPIFRDPPEGAARVAVPVVPPPPVEDEGPGLWDLDPEAWWHWYLDNDACRETVLADLARVAADTVVQTNAGHIAAWSGHVDDLVLAVRFYPSVAARLGVDPAALAKWRVPPEAEAAARQAAERSERGERDDWAGYLVVEAPQRDELMARYRVPFRVLAVRRRMVPSYVPGLGPKDRWELMISRAPLGVKMIVRLPPGNQTRDKQLEWLQERAPLEQPLCLYHEERANGRRLLCLTRCDWPAPDDRWEHLPTSVRKRLLREG